MEKLEGTWMTEDENGLVFYAPHDDVYGDAEIIDEGDWKSATYEWHESGKRIILYYADDWGDKIEATFEYEIKEPGEEFLYASEMGFDESMILELTIVQTTDSWKNTRTYDEEEPTTFYKSDDEN